MSRGDNYPDTGGNHKHAIDPRLIKNSQIHIKLDLRINEQDNSKKENSTPFATGCSMCNSLYLLRIKPYLQRVTAKF